MYSFGWVKNKGLSFFYTKPPELFPSVGFPSRRLRIAALVSRTQPKALWEPRVVKHTRFWFSGRMRYMSMLGKLLSVGVGVSYLVSAVVNTMAFFGFPNVMAGRITSFLLVAAWLGLAFYMGWFQRRKFVRFTLIFWVAAAVLVAGVTVISDLVLPIEFGNIFGSIHTVVLMLFAAPIFGFQLPIDSMYYFVVVMLLIAVLSLVSYKIGRIAKERNAAACSCSRD